MRVASLFVVLALSQVCLAVVGGNHWFVWTQGSDINGEWGYLNFYPKSLAVNRGDYITFIQNHDSGIIAVTSTPGPPIQFYPPPAGQPPGSPAGPCLDARYAPCTALTPLSMPYVGGPMGNETEQLTHINTTTGTFEYSSGFMAAAEEMLPVPYYWTFYIDDALPYGTLDFYEVLHVIKMTITVTAEDLEPLITPASSNTSAMGLMQTDANTAGQLFTQLVTPINDAASQYNQKTKAWVVHLGVQSNGTSEGYGIGSFDRFIPFDTSSRKSTITINQGDTIEFLQITPHAHSVSIYKFGHDFPAEALIPAPEFHTFVEPLTHFVPQPVPNDKGVQVFNDSTPFAVTGPFLFPGTSARVKFDVSPGTYPYFCFFHVAVSMTGEIVVAKNGTVPIPTAGPTTGAASILSAPLFIIVAVVMLLFQL